MVTSVRRDALLALLALGLLAAPLWAPAFHLDDTAYRYERARLTTESQYGIDYANRSVVAEATGFLPISKDIVCTIGTSGRACAFESYLAANHTVPSTAYTNNPNLTRDSFHGLERYQYVLVNGTAYATIYVPNQSVQNDRGWYRLDLGLERRSLDEVLRSVSLNVTQDREEIPAVVYRAATSGEATAHHEVAVPQTPIRLANGTYYRVFLAGRTEPAPLFPFYHAILVFGLPVAGLGILYRVSQRVEITYIGE
jgi:hypothetical protein